MNDDGGRLSDAPDSVTANIEIMEADEADAAGIEQASLRRWLEESIGSAEADEVPLLAEFRLSGRESPAARVRRKRPPIFIYDPDIGIRCRLDGDAFQDLGVAEESDSFRAQVVCPSEDAHALLSHLRVADSSEASFVKLQINLHDDIAGLDA